MPVSEAKIAANRRNALKSTGPRTIQGKRCSSLNAVTHGLRAETVVVLDEDPQELEDRRVAWHECLLPANDVEERLVDAAVVYTWQQDRARRAQASRINANITNYEVEQDQTTEEEVVALGRRLFKDRLGPLVFYPTGSHNIGTYSDRDPTTSHAGKQDDADLPFDLVLRLHSTLLGCEWLLGQWASLKTVLDQGQAWIPSDKLKAVRLLGKQPFDAIDEKDVAMIFLASFVLKADKGRWDWEITMEMSKSDTITFRKNAATRQLDALTPSDATKAREALLEIIERATARLTIKADAHRERARVMAALATDFLAFDDSLHGERLRRFDLAAGRGLSRSLDDLRKRRRDAENVSGPFSVRSSALSVVSGPLSVSGCNGEAVTEAIATNEPTDARENLTNEPTVDRENVTNEPTVDRENVTNEPTVDRENVTNEPTDAEGGNDTSLEPGAITNHKDDVGLQAEIEPDQTFESYEQGVARRKARRAESLRKLNEDARKEVADAMALRRAHRGERRNLSGKAGGQPNGGVARAGLGMGLGSENNAEQMTELDEFEKTALALYGEAHVAPS